MAVRASRVACCRVIFLSSFTCLFAVSRWPGKVAAARAAAEAWTTIDYVLAVTAVVGPVVFCLLVYCMWHHALADNEKKTIANFLAKTRLLPRFVVRYLQQGCVSSLTLLLAWRRPLPRHQHAHAHARRAGVDTPAAGAVRLTVCPTPASRRASGSTNTVLST